MSILRRIDCKFTCILVILILLFKVNCIDIITTIAGTGASSYSGDNGQATSAAIKHPSGIVLDSAGNIYFSDLHNNRVRKITVSTGIITTYAGTGASSYSGDKGIASSAALAYPNGLGIDTSGNATNNHIHSNG